MSHIIAGAFSIEELQTLKSIGIEDLSCLGRLSRIKVGAGNVIFQPGDESKTFLVLLQGQIRVDLISKSDRETVLYRMHAAEICIITATTLLQSGTYFARGVAETDIIVLAIPQHTFEQLMKNSADFSHFVLQDYANRVASLVKLVSRLTDKNILADLGGYLREKMDAKGCVLATQADIARTIGTAREVVSRKLAELEKQGIVRRERGRIIVTDKLKLP
ncbi:MAG: Crp/Fnr family transcriptional regulator [Robiginitomaculum sp.]|nr:Crp/Fnr family transcriptional regulator [Robiginitomaculum sp.]